MIKLELAKEEVQLILNAVGNLPYGQVEALVANIRNQAIPQVMEQEQKEELINNEAP